MYTLHDAIQLIRPNAEFALKSKMYSGIEWRDPVQSKPTEQEVADAMSALESEEARQDSIKAAQLITEWEDRMRNKSLAQIKTAFDGATTAQKNDLLFALLLRWALEVR